MHTLVKLVALSVEKYYMALTEIQIQICRFHGSLSQKGSRPLVQNISFNFYLCLLANVINLVGLQCSCGRNNSSIARRHPNKARRASAKGQLQYRHNLTLLLFTVVCYWHYCLYQEAPNYKIKPNRQENVSLTPKLVSRISEQNTLLEG